MRPPQVVGLGLATVDIVIRLESMPRWERAGGFSDFAIQGGGMCGTAMVAASRLGLSAGWVGTAGSDSAAEIKLGSLREEGVDVSRAVRREGREKQIILVYVHESTGERVFAGMRGMGEEPLRPEELDRGYLTSADALLVDGCHPEAALQAARWMRRAGRSVVLDAGATRSAPSAAFRRLVEEAHVVISGSGFAEAATGLRDPVKAGTEILKLGPEVFVQTQGAGGCLTVSADGSFRTPALPVAVVDTTGAGDTFHGAYLVGLTERWPLEQTVLFASAAAAMSCRRLGGRSGIPHREAVLAFLAERGHPAER